MSERRLDLFDRLLVNVDRAVRTLTRDSRPALRISPAWCFEEPVLSAEERAHAASLMRVNHAGEVCAQALYQGQALTAKLPTVGAEMARAADEEVDHLAWCEERIQELGSHTSLLNPLWYGMSFVLGAAAGVVGDRYSLGFVSATEEQVCEHLKNHLQSLPASDDKSRSILEQMLTDEEKHGHAALEAGGIRFPAPVKRAMSLVSTVMTEASYRI